MNNFHEWNIIVNCEWVSEWVCIHTMNIYSHIFILISILKCRINTQMCTCVGWRNFNLNWIFMKIKMQSDQRHLTILMEGYAQGEKMWTKLDMFGMQTDSSPSVNEKKNNFHEYGWIARKWSFFHYWDFRIADPANNCIISPSLPPSIDLLILRRFNKKKHWTCTKQGKTQAHTHMWRVKRTPPHRNGKKRHFNWISRFWCFTLATCEQR